ncbi:hypothetical protein WA026_014833 [Henosepilachna vigintioctopunctata]|uniref:Large ribosomal subunit protein mL64 n=1 Tax=Henosepilachna vigintioctopunctata TaxID=420089 RepID=A0AAW1V2F1_9CUCU
MFRKEIVLSSHHRYSFLLRKVFKNYFSSNVPINIEKLEQESENVDLVETDIALKEEQIQLKRNKSRLRENDRRFLLETNPYPEDRHWHHGTIKYKRRLYGRYGKESGVDPAICWPTDQELQDVIEYEKVAYPYTILEMVKTAQESRNLKNIETAKRQQDILVKLSKLEGWKRDMEMRIAKKESEANAARQKKERLIEEVRKHFGYKVDPKDDKFKELLEKKEKEQKKIDKEARRKEREAKLMEKLKNKKKENKDTNEATSENIELTSNN